MPHERPASLQDAQRAMARLLRQAPSSEVSVDVAEPAIWATRAPFATADRLAVYRNNTVQFFRGALALTYPVLQRRVGDDFFRQLAHEYRAAHPSRSGDLHWIGEAFPAWLAQRLEGGDYAWLADLARLEWACEVALNARVQPPLALAALGELPADRLDATALGLQPSLQFLSSPWPIWSVWQANQGDDPGAPVDFSGGGEDCACACTGERVVVYRLEPGVYAVAAALAGGASFAQALETSGQSPATLARTLQWAFDEALVVALNPSARA